MSGWTGLVTDIIRINQGCFYISYSHEYSVRVAPPADMGDNDIYITFRQASGVSVWISFDIIPSEFDKIPK